jgi:hypothetical protein
METLGNQKLQKSCNKYSCKICNYVTSRKSSYDKHTLTAKHVNYVNGNQMETESCKKLQNNCNYICKNCNKEYFNKSGLWKHNVKCKINVINQHAENSKDDIIQLLIKQNNDFFKEQTDIKQIILEIAKNGTNNNNNNGNTNIINSNNKTFNLHVFLNETCKDAMNISDFIESVKLQVSDLENVGKVGYIEGISNIIIKNLSALEVNKRPVHCADQKRDVMYVKDENIWEKDDENNK